jgi:uncharacterized repeat protein (TIGR01451 family)
MGHLRAFSHHKSLPMRIAVAFLAVLSAVGVAGAVGVSAASAESPWWNLSSTARPANLPPGGEGTVVVKAVNIGDQTTSGNMTLSDTLPAGLTVQSAGFYVSSISGSTDLSGLGTCVTTPSRVQCGYPGEFELPAVKPYEFVELRIVVKVATGAVSGESHLAMTGGGAPDASFEQQLVVSGAPTPFGAEDFRFIPEEEGGAVDLRAGSHPFQLTASFSLNQTADVTKPPALPKDLRFQLPPGLVGNATAVAQCSERDFAQIAEDGHTDLCPADTAIGVATVNLYTEFLETYSVPLFNLAPRPGEPARFGFEIQKSPVMIDTSVRSGHDYGVTSSVSDITQLVGFLSSQISFWGVPGDPRHDQSRGWACVPGGAEGQPCLTTHEHNPAPLLTLPTSCNGPLTTTLEGDSWPTKASPAGIVLPQREYQLKDGLGRATEMTGCDQLPFDPSINVTPDGTAGSTPTGLNVDVHVPQEETANASGLAEAAPKDITVALPEGVAVNPSSGDGLGACSEGLAGFTGFAEIDPIFEPGTKTATFTPRLPGSIAALAAGETESLRQAVNFCPNASKVATVKLKTPILPNTIEGAAYLANQNENPFGGLLALYVIAEDPVSGVLVKLAGNVHVTETGQLVTTFENSPQAPFEDAELHFFGGERAPLATPARCGAYTTTASMTPWSGSATSTSSSTFSITSGPNGSPCPGASLPFSPSLTGGTTNINAGSLSPLTTTIAREDGNQNLQSVQLHMPAGLEGILAGVKLCDEADANAGTCSAESQIGETTVSAGVGADPVNVTGKVYITEKYAGAPFGLSIVNPVKTGPFDLEHDTSNPNNQPPCDCLVVRAKIEVDPLTAQLTITTDPSGPHAIPHLIDGIPVQIKRVNVLINRKPFTFNPTNCSAFAITGSIASDEGATQPLSVPFQATNCATLKFTPKFAAATSGKTSKANGASLHVKLTYPKAPQGTQANIAKVKVDLPKQLPSRLTTLQKACAAAVFDANPASCPAASVVGHAKATTPLVPVPLEGPAYFVSHGNEAFPSLIVTLQGYGVTVDLVGTTFISKAGITSSTFKSVPDVPVGSFELTLPEGKYSALAANGNLCAGAMVMPTAFVAQNGAEIHQSTPISVEGCSSALSVSSHSINKSTLTVSVLVPSAGKLKASGKGIASVTKTVKGREALKLKLTRKRAGRLSTTIKLAFTPTKGHRQARSLAVKFAK